MNYLSIAVIARGEAPYVWEWAKYHLGMGVDHIYYYDNDPNPAAASLLSHTFFKYVTVLSFKGDTQQTNMTMHALNTFRHATRWLAFIDVDEFLVPLKTDNLKLFLEPYERYSAVCPHWRIFGSNGRKSFEPIPVIERFTKRAREVDRHIKSIVDPTRTFRWVTVHKYTHCSPAVDEHSNPIPETESRPEPATADLIQLNHYATKSYEECLERRNRPRADIAAVHEMPRFFEAHDKNEVEDTVALNYWLKIRGSNESRSKA